MVKKHEDFVPDSCSKLLVLFLQMHVMESASFSNNSTQP
jgi:hypothetical protein